MVALLGLFLLVGIFFHKIIFFNQSYFYGDYAIQHYPWASFLHESLRNFTLPFWTSEIGCGFPLFAEGQVGALDPINLVCHFALPMDAAYSATFILSFILGGYFTYRYARSIQISQSGSGLASLLFLFGSSYMGLVYGPAAMRCFVWFSLGLEFVHGLVCQPSTRKMAGLSLAVGLAYLSGYPQAAFYHTVFYLLYAVFWLFLHREGKRFRWDRIGWVLAAAFFGIMLSLPQLIPTLQMALHSARADASVTSALSQSYNPLGLAALFWPSLSIFVSYDLYLGVLSLFLVYLAIQKFQVDKRIQCWLILIVICFLFAIGRLNPLYTGIVQIFHLSFLRFPSKWMIYLVYGLVILAALGWERLDKKNENSVRVLWVAGWIFVLAFFLARFLGEWIVGAVTWYVEHYVHQKPGHLYPMEIYIARIQQYFKLLLERTSFANPLFLTSAGLWGISFFVFSSKWPAFLTSQRKKIIFTVLVLDLFLHLPQGTGFAGNCISKDLLAPDEISDYLSKEESHFRVYTFSPKDTRAPKWVAASNIPEGFSNIGVYSPLVAKSYREFVSDLGSVDDATGAIPTDTIALKKNITKLAEMNTRYVISPIPLDASDEYHYVLRSKSGDYLYEINHFKPRASVTLGMIESVKYFLNRIEIRAYSNDNTQLILRERFDQGWIAKVNGVKAVLSSADEIFMQLELPKGASFVVLNYQPRFFVHTVWLSLGVGFILLFLAMQNIRLENK